MADSSVTINLSLGLNVLELQPPPPPPSQTKQRLVRSYKACILVNGIVRESFLVLLFVGRGCKILVTHRRGLGEGCVGDFASFAIFCESEILSNWNFFFFSFKDAVWGLGCRSGVEALADHVQGLAWILSTSETNKHARYQK